MRKCLFLTFALVVLITGVSFAQTDQAIQSIPSTIHISNFTTDTYFSTSGLNSTNAKTQQRYNVIENGVVIAVASVTSVNKQGAYLRIISGKDRVKTSSIKNYQLTFLDYKPVLLSHSEIQPVKTEPAKTAESGNQTQIQEPTIPKEDKMPNDYSASVRPKNPDIEPRELSLKERGILSIVDLGNGKYRVHVDPKAQRAAFIKLCKERGWKYKSENGD